MRIWKCNKENLSKQLKGIFSSFIITFNYLIFDVDGFSKICFINVLCLFVGRAALQKRVMALLRRIEHPTAGNTEVNFLLNFCPFHVFFFSFFWTQKRLLLWVVLKLNLVISYFRPGRIHMQNGNKLQN